MKCAFEDMATWSMRLLVIIARCARFVMVPHLKQQKRKKKKINGEFRFFISDIWSLWSRTPWEVSPPNPSLHGAPRLSAIEATSRLLETLKNRNFDYHFYERLLWSQESPNHIFHLSQEEKIFYQINHHKLWCNFAWLQELP